MADLVRARLNAGAEVVEKNMSRDFAEGHGLEVLDEPTRRPDGRIRATTRRNGRPRKPKTSVSVEAAKKKATDEDASTPEEAQQ